MKTAINTRTQEEYDALQEYVIKTKGKYIPAFWEAYKENTCVNIETLSCARIGFYKELDIPIIPYTEFAKANIVEEPDWKTKYEEAYGNFCDTKKDLERTVQERDSAQMNLADMGDELDFYKALYLEGRELLDKVCDAYTPETNEQDEIQHKIKAFLTKHNDLT